MPGREPCLQRSMSKPFLISTIAEDARRPRSGLPWRVPHHACAPDARLGYAVAGSPSSRPPPPAPTDGRQLIYDLSGRYANSLLLNFAIQKILQQPGREAEVAAVGPRLGSYFGVFHRLMVTRLSAALASTSERELDKLSAEIQARGGGGPGGSVPACLRRFREEGCRDVGSRPTFAGPGYAERVVQVAGLLLL